MPRIGETKSACKISKVGSGKYIWQACVDCGAERWVQLTRNEPASVICCQCRGHRIRGKNHPNWKGGSIRSADGYVTVHIYPEDFFYPMADKQNRIFEHRLVMAKLLGRCLHSWEIVHHKGTKYPKGSKENRGDNRTENLQLVSDLGNKQLALLEGRIRRLEEEVIGLRGQLAQC